MLRHRGISERASFRTEVRSMDYRDGRLIDLILIGSRTGECVSRSDRRSTAQRLSIRVSDFYPRFPRIPLYIVSPAVAYCAKTVTVRANDKKAVSPRPVQVRFKEGPLCIGRNVFQDCLLDHMEISIVEAEKRANRALNLREFYTVYLIETKVTDTDFKNALTRISSLWRRYTEFELLRAYLEISYPYIVLPPLPEKKVLYAWQKVTTDTFDPDFVDRRRAGLENFLIRVASHPVLSRDEHFMGFLQQKDGWRESVKETGYLQIAESKLKALSVAVRLRKPDKRFETIKNYGIELQNNLCNLLRVRARLVEKQHSLYKLHANYGRVFSEWSAIEKGMGDELQKSGHYLDSLAATIDTTLEEEELIVDQLKEWLFGASALQAVVRRREALQLAKDEAHDALTAAFEQKDKVMQGKTGLMSRLFGSVDTEEVRELKILQLEQRIAQHDETVKQVDEDLKSFSIKAMMDIERFQHQKVVDLKETLAAYCVLQFKLARKGLQAWQHIKGCLESIP